MTSSVENLQNDEVIEDVHSNQETSGDATSSTKQEETP
jgi:hypothetical protein